MGGLPAPIGTDFMAEDPFDFDSFINWPEDGALTQDAAGVEEG